MHQLSENSIIRYLLVDSRLYTPKIEHEFIRQIPQIAVVYTSNNLKWKNNPFEVFNLPEVPKNTYIIVYEELFGSQSKIILY